MVLLGYEEDKKKVIRSKSLIYSKDCTSTGYGQSYFRCYPYIVNLDDVNLDSKERISSLVFYNEKKKGSLGLYLVRIHTDHQ
jgi:hypothetical protein